MFQLKAGFSEQVEWRTSAEAAREFFGDLRNFVELMPGVERITADARGIASWLIRAEVPVVGAIRQAFAVRKSVDEPTRVRIEQRVELRRASARELHTLAGVAGEGRLSAALQKGVTEMLQAFLQRARTRLEK